MRTQCRPRVGWVALVIPLLLCANLLGCAGIPQALAPGIQVTQEDLELAEWAVRTSYPPIKGEDEDDTLLRLQMLEPAVKEAPRRGEPHGRPNFSAPVSPIAERHIAAYTRALHSWTRHTGREIAAAIDNTTGVQMGPVHQGNEESIAAPGIEITLLARADVTVLHTHPASGSFSPIDVEFFLAHPQVRRMVLTIPNGTMYVLERTAESREPDRFSPAGSAWPHAMNVAFLSDLLSGSRLVNPTLNQWHTYPDLYDRWHELNARFAARLGYTYRRLSPKGE